jgi:hypothetical protein
VLDTAVETLLMDEVARVTNVSDTLAAQPDAQSWLLVRNKNDPSWMEANVPKDERARVEADLAAGYAVVLPRQAASGGRSAPGWWRVDPATGQTLGMDGHGRGAAIIEYTLNFHIVFAVCLAGGAAAGKAGGSTPSGERDVAGNRRAIIICAFVAVGFAAMAPMLATTSALKVIVGGVATGAAGGYAL